MVNDKIIRESELILNSDGSIYHLNIKPEHLADTVILLGDPGRVKMVSNLFDDIVFKSENREFIIHTGLIQDRKITAMSTGMGTDNIDIVLNELDALANVDFDKRKIKTQHKALNLIRLGTSGSLQADLPLNSVVVSDCGIGLDGMLYFYDFKESDYQKKLRKAFMEHTSWSNNLPRPYVFKASQKLNTVFSDDHVYKGLTATSPGFYGPQGRKIRLKLAYPQMNDLLETFSYEQQRILNYEMETSALYALSQQLGHHAQTICLAIANRKQETVNNDYHGAMEDLIKWVLQKVIQL